MSDHQGCNNQSINDDAEEPVTDGWGHKTDEAEEPVTDGWGHTTDDAAGSPPLPWPCQSLPHLQAEGRCIKGFMKRNREAAGAEGGRGVGRSVEAKHAPAYRQACKRAYPHTQT